MVDTRSHAAAAASLTRNTSTMNDKVKDSDIHKPDRRERQRLRNLKKTAEPRIKQPGRRERQRLCNQGTALQHPAPNTSPTNNATQVEGNFESFDPRNKLHVPNLREHLQFRNQETAVQHPAPNTSPRNNIHAVDDSTQQPKPRRVRPGRRERHRRRNLKITVQQACDTSKKPPFDLDKKQPAPESDSQPSKSKGSGKQSKSKKRSRKSRGKPDRLYYSKARPSYMHEDVRFRALSVHLSKVLEASTINVKSDLETFVKKERDAFRDHLTAYIKHRQWDDANLQKRRDEDVDLLKNFVHKLMEKEKDNLRKMYEKHDKDMEWLENDLFDELRQRLDGQDGHWQGHLYAQKSEVEPEMRLMKGRMEAMENRMREMGQNIDGVLKVSNDQHRWGFRAPEPLAEDSE